jgi:hypothetical protein
VVKHELSIDNIIHRAGEVNKLVDLLNQEQVVNFKKKSSLNLSMLRLNK